MALGWLKTVLSAPANVTTLVDGAVNGLDKLKYTAEEKAEDSAKLLQMQADIRLKAQEQVVAWMKATAPQARTRRMLVRLIAALWAAAFTLPIAFNVIAVWWLSRAAQLQKSAELIADQADRVDQYMLLAVGYYLAAPHVAGVFDTIVASKQGRRKLGEPDNTDGA